MQNNQRLGWVTGSRRYRRQNPQERRRAERLAEQLRALAIKPD
ncbi:hypothetical protein [Nostoc sp.]